MEHRDLLAEPDLTAAHRWAAGQGCLLGLLKGEAGRIFLQFQPCVASDAAHAGCKVWLVWINGFSSQDRRCWLDACR
jgi:hypothetical protein